MRPVFILLCFAFSICLRAEDKADDNVDFMADAHIVILGAYKKFDHAKSDAEQISKKLKIPFTMNGMIFDSKRWLILSDDSEDEIYAGTYINRRYHKVFIDGKDSEGITIEKSGSYSNFREGFYIIVAGIFPTAKEAETFIMKNKILTHAPKSYFKKTRLYYGCRH